MTKTTDKLLRELETFDPVSPAELEDACKDAGELLERVLRFDPGEGPDARAGVDERGRGLRGIPVFVALTAVAIALFVLLIGLPGGGGRVERRMDAALRHAASAAAVRSTPVANQPYTYLETRQFATEGAGGKDHSRQVVRRTTRQEWVGWNGSGRLRVTTTVPGPGAEPRIEDRWIEAGLLDREVEELPTGPATLAVSLREDAQRTRPGVPPGATILGLVAADLRSPLASPALRRALYRALALTPGLEYLGPTVDPEGRRGVAVGVTGAFVGHPARFSLIFDPRTSMVLATETTALRPGEADGAANRPQRATVYLESRGAASPAPRPGSWLADYEPSSLASPPTSPFLVYRIPDASRWARTAGDAPPVGGWRG
jgi:hypothetical protein